MVLIELKILLTLFLLVLVGAVLSEVFQESKVYMIILSLLFMMMLAVFVVFMLTLIWI